MSIVPLNTSGKQWMITLNEGSAVLRYDSPSEWWYLKTIPVSIEMATFLKACCEFNTIFNGWVIYSILADY